MDKLLDMEIESLQGERMMGETELRSTQSSISEKLHGAMGNDMIDVLDGKKKIVMSKKLKLRYRINNFFKMLFGDNEQ